MESVQSVQVQAEGWLDWTGPAKLIAKDHSEH
jgi:hypothetical protein